MTLRTLRCCPNLRCLPALRVAPANASTSLSNTPPKKSLDGAAARSTLQHSPRKPLF